MRQQLLKSLQNKSERLKPIMKILVTGAKGFIGKNLIAELKIENIRTFMNMIWILIHLYLMSTAKMQNFVFHLAGVNRPKEQSEFMKETSVLLQLYLIHSRSNNNACPIMISSSIQAELDNPYGKSKKAGEDLLLNYGNETGAKVLIYRFPNVFGKWCRPNYNSAVATFCHNIAHDLPITVNDPSVLMKPSLYR
jgi:UDP-2-acetamido-2,6-beta-L-arabino-hexul-4-ose reductase